MSPDTIEESAGLARRGSPWGCVVVFLVLLAVLALLLAVESVVLAVAK